MNLTLHKSSIFNQSSIVITGSKSESNRLLLLQALFPQIQIGNLSNSDDSIVMKKALKSEERILDIHHAGTAMRFLTAFFAIQEGREVILTGSARMKERPIKILVDALNELGADISYLKTEGYPPLRITGKSITKNKVTLKANVSSQYISALLLIAPKLKNGLQLTLEGEITSIPYINMTLDLLYQIGVQNTFVENKINITPHSSPLTSCTLIVESDWSSASYFYSMVALSPLGTSITLSSYNKNSLQGDSVLTEIYSRFGVTTNFNGSAITLLKMRDCKLHTVNLHLQNSPDIAQTIVVTCYGLGIRCHLTGLHTLKIKETDRLVALKAEMEKFGADIDITEDSLTLKPSSAIKSGVRISTYNDHRMAMAFATLALKTSIHIEDAMVVSKSYPTFWADLKSIGFKITE
ncbi:MAG TPA: 3-phosphoshikimate 1-carboxyvinyltransferase [Aquaticitalea sp.]|nr:3-phosphoshikimate 1-carboxyvinyltransferase [Aquaticitalea sp.]